jgi:hypothetical protein
MMVMLPLISRLAPGTRLLLGIVLAAVLGLPNLAGAASISATGTSYFGPDLSVTLTIDDGIDPGNLVITLTVDPGVNTGDLRAFYAQIADESLIPGLTVSGADVTSSLFAANLVNDVGTGSGVTNISSPCLCDFGVGFGIAGSQGDDLQSVTFVLSHVTEGLTIDLFADQGFAVRANSVAPPSDGHRRGTASKLTGLVVVPEPTNAMLMLLGLAGLTFAGRRQSTSA